MASKFDDMDHLVSVLFGDLLSLIPKIQYVDCATFCVCLIRTIIVVGRFWSCTCTTGLVCVCVCVYVCTHTHMSVMFSVLHTVHVWYSKLLIVASVSS